ncbi:MAG: 2OG-Fe(II) oxygenase [Candidatus Lambdaproteobacteria bacterium]|nr:2OG-Fe(II) oxygenase [Candidatus Lambdaproteobacteria bacterium]
MSHSTPRSAAHAPAPALSDAPGDRALRDLHTRMAGQDWPGMTAALDDVGWARTGALLAPADCAALMALYDDDARFRSRIEMSRYRFGEGSYAYFAHPLPAVVNALRRAAYPHLAAIANAWRAGLGLAAPYPPSLDEYLARCHAAGQTRPTPLLLRYAEGGYNCLHQDRYGELYFPLQLVVMLSRAGEDYEGGEFLLVENRPRAQSVGHAVTLAQGQGLIFPGIERPVQGARGTYRVKLRHGVSRITRGSRHTLGIIFHDAA